MVRPNPRRQPKHKDSFAKIVKGPVATSQAIIRVGGGRKATATTFQRWDEGTAALEAEYAKQRSKPHAFVPMGRLGVCDKCAAGEFATIDGRAIHTGMKPRAS